MAFRILVVFGTRPEAIKMAPVVLALKAEKEFFLCRVAVTAQHREMLDQVLKLFNITPDYDLNLMSPGQGLGYITSGVVEGMEKVYEDFRPDLVLVHGDTTTTMAASLAAFYCHIPVGHVEAGLRTGDKWAPYPEEMNRRLTGALADLHLAPTSSARENLLREGVAPETIFVTGNTVIDALLATVHREPALPEELGNVDFSRRVLLVTAHRRENWGEPLEDIFKAVGDLVAAYRDLEVVFPVHKNPRVRKAALDILKEVPRVHLVEPLDYAPFVAVLMRSHLVLTDSGGLQEEAPSMGKPVLVLRQVTERPEAVSAGTVRLVGTERRQVVEEVSRLLDSSGAYLDMAHAVNPYGDGCAANRILEAVKFRFGMTKIPPEEFIKP